MMTAACSSSCRRGSGTGAYVAVSITDRQNAQLLSRTTLLCLAVHHSLLDIVKALFYEAGAIVIFLSPYSPDLNPIEQCFKHLKAFFKRNLSFNYAMLHLGLRTVTPQMMRAFCGHSGIVVEDPRVAAAALRRRRQLATLALLILS